MPGALLDLRPGRERTVLAKPHGAARHAQASRQGRKAGADKARFQEKFLRLTLCNTYLKPKQVGWYKCTKANG